MTMAELRKVEILFDFVRFCLPGIWWWVGFCETSPSTFTSFRPNDKKSSSKAVFSKSIAAHGLTVYIKGILKYDLKFSPPSPSQPLWRNGLAHWTSNSKVVGSSPTRGVVFFLFFFFFNILLSTYSTILFVIKVSFFQNKKERKKL